MISIEDKINYYQRLMMSGVEEHDLLNLLDDILMYKKNVPVAEEKIQELWGLYIAKLRSYRVLGQRDTILQQEKEREVRELLYFKGLIHEKTEEDKNYNIKWLGHIWGGRRIWAEDWEEVEGAYLLYRELTGNSLKVNHWSELDFLGIPKIPHSDKYTLDDVFKRVKPIYTGKEHYPYPEALSKIIYYGILGGQVVVRGLMGDNKTVLIQGSSGTGETFTGFI